MSKSPPSIIGIDASLRSSGWYAGRERFGVIKTSSSDLAPLVIIRDSLARVLDRAQPEIAVIENTFFASNAKTLKTLAEVSGVIKELLAERHLNVYTPTVMQARAALGIPGRATKERVYQEWEALHPGDWSFKTANDISDSWALWSWGMKQFVKKEEE